MAEAFTVKAYQCALVEEFSAAVEAVLGGVTTVPVPDPASGPGWRLSGAASGGLDGAIVAWVDKAGAELLAQRVMGMDETPDEATVADMLREMWSQAAGTLSLKEPFIGIKLVIAAAEPAEAPATTVVFDVQLGESAARVAVGGNAMAAEPVATLPAIKPPAPVMQNDNLDVVLDMELPLVVRFGRTVMSLRALSALGPGSIVDMERSPDEPVQMLVGDQVIARGEVVVVGGNYGVRVTDLVSPAERVRSTR